MNFLTRLHDGSPLLFLFFAVQFTININFYIKYIIRMGQAQSNILLDHVARSAALLLTYPPASIPPMAKKL
ncbi:hypothetical protein D3C80_1766260 [compost metagenome]